MRHLRTLCYVRVEMNGDVSKIHIGLDSLDEIRRVLVNESQALKALSEQVDVSYLKALELILKAGGKLVTSGMGKSGIVARKAASTFVSTGTISVFMHPCEALHGDLGIVSPADVLLIFGKSGESSEVSALLPNIKRLGAKIIAVTARPDSTLARAADVVLIANTGPEACLYDLAPTTSTIAAMAIADALALTLMRLKNFKPQDYAQIHPGGSLGYRLTFAVRDVMIPLSKHPALNPDQIKIEDVISHLGMVGLVLFSKDGQKLDGIMTDGDVRRALETHQAKIFDQKIAMFINSKPLSVDASIRAAEALRFMEQRERPLNAVPVLENGRITGVLRLHDLLR